MKKFVWILLMVCLTKAGYAQGLDQTVLEAVIQKVQVFCHYTEQVGSCSELTSQEIQRICKEEISRLFVNDKTCYLITYKGTSSPVKRLVSSYIQNLANQRHAGGRVHMLKMSVNKQTLKQKLVEEKDSIETYIVEVEVPQALTISQKDGSNKQVKQSTMYVNVEIEKKNDNIISMGLGDIRQVLRLNQTMTE